MTSDPRDILLLSSFVSTSVEEWAEIGLCCLCGVQEGQGKRGVKRLLARCQGWERDRSAGCSDRALYSIPVGRGGRWHLPSPGPQGCSRCSRMAARTGLPGTSLSCCWERPRGGRGGSLGRPLEMQWPEVIRCGRLLTVQLPELFTARGSCPRRLPLSEQRKGGRWHLSL